MLFSSGGRPASFAMGVSREPDLRPTGVEREDFSDVTVLRVKAPTLLGDETTESLFAQAYSVVEDAGRAGIVRTRRRRLHCQHGVGEAGLAAMQKARAAGGKLILCEASETSKTCWR